ncbi:hypothetical protein CGGC5_v012196 [Colletotrichum fructicola Nara gc5]|uniref:Tyrosine-protein phosphatase non-receptor type 6 n=1 Tax=Colletotrichum fructicola (strain Nara gc5) TaxID=1213859 RepID=A0A7J6ISH9_COLFN|nr:hypothetical protein CGGC5_v012196 [Colletotrichum fructicola Nara gc5]KAF5490752.1 hypothetical protein CGCF413_v011144 [Colletotrichum fructicola]
MHPAPSLVEAPPKNGSEESGNRPQTASPSMSQHELPQSAQTPAQQQPQPQPQPQPSPPPPQQQQAQQQTTPQQQQPQLPPPTPGQSASPPLRKDTNSSISTQATAASAASNMSAETNNTSRRTGPLSQQQREKAALIRKLGACNDCRRRRVACHPSHHNMTWEDAVRKYHRSHSPTIQDIAPSLSAQRPLSPAPLINSVKPMYPQDAQDMMEIDSPTPPGQHRLSESRIRTPLPSGPRLDKPPMLPGIESLKSDLQTNVSRILSTPSRSRYSSAQALLLYWQDDPDLSVGSSVKELSEVLDQYYRYTFSISPIPSSSEACKNPWRWLSRKITDFVEDRDQRDVLKIVYYNGHSYLDGNREMVLASSKDVEKAETIRWSGIQQVLEEACSDTLIIMDAAFFPSSKMHRQQGVLELIAAAVSEEHFDALDRCTFTKVLTEHLKTRASQRYANPFSAAELHSKLLSNYPSLVQDRNPEKETITSFPSPLHMQMSGNARLPSILLAPLNIGPMRSSLPFGTEGQQLVLSIRIGDDPIDVDNWTEWLRMMPDGIKDVRVDGPYRPAR